MNSFNNCNSGNACCDKGSCGCDCLIWILILLLCCGGCGSHSCGSGCSCILPIIVLLCSCGGCGCGSKC